MFTKYLAFNIIAFVTYFFPIVSTSLIHFFLLSASKGPSPSLNKKVSKHPVWYSDHIPFLCFLCQKKTRKQILLEFGKKLSLWLYSECCITIPLFLCSCTWKSLNFPMVSVLANMWSYC